MIGVASTAHAPRDPARLYHDAYGHPQRPTVLSRASPNKAQGRACTSSSRAVIFLLKYALG